jgi:pimeloyl-ACP methyl ester carboxylesterase
MPTPTPETRYARSGDVHVAYQVTGGGSADVVFVPGWVSHVEHAWEEPSYAPFLERLAGFSRLILLDRRGTGLSDPVDRLPTLEERMDDLRAVMDAAGSARAFVFGISESGPMVALFAATHPERTAGLVLCNTFARGMRSDEDPEAPWTQQSRQAIESAIESGWGTGVTARIFAPSRAGDPDFVRSWGRFERRAVGKGAMRKIVAMAIDTDVRDVLASIRVPTLVLHRSGDRPVPIAAGRRLAEAIPGARFVEVPGTDHFPWVGDTEAILGEVEHFVTGARGLAEPDRVLATVLFVDIVDSTRRVAERGDRAWRELLARFHALVGRQLERYRGREIDTTGDGVFATFDGPARAIRCACAIRDAVAALGIEVRAGLHTGECEVHASRVSGIAVHTGARICASAGPGEVRVSRTVRDLVAGSTLRFADRGVHALRGVAGEWRLFAAEPP